MNSNNVELRLLVKGRPVTEYPHNGNVYIEGREGSDFEIEIINRNTFRVEAVVSVDGLSVINGKEASDTSPGYLLEANETIRIPGWKLDDTSAASFVFSGKSGSYASQATGSTQNTGVIGMMIFREAVRPNSFSTTFGATSGSPLGIMRGISVCHGINSATLSSSSNSLLASSVASTEPVEQQLGTGFGAATSFATQSVAFKRGDLLAMVVVFYDNIRGLKARGVPMERVRTATYRTVPQAFPGMNCQPPQNWKGR